MFGYVVWWPAAGLPVLSDEPPAAWPEWLAAVAELHIGERCPRGSRRHAKNERVDQAMAMGSQLGDWLSSVFSTPPEDNKSRS